MVSHMPPPNNTYEIMMAMERQMIEAMNPFIPVRERPHPFNNICVGGPHHGQILNVITGHDYFEIEFDPNPRRVQFAVELTQTNYSYERFTYRRVQISHDFAFWVPRDVSPDRVVEFLIQTVFDFAVIVDDPTR